MDHSDRVFISVTQKGDLYNVALIIEDIDVADSGLYSVVASNEGGQNKAAFTLNVDKGREFC